MKRFRNKKSARNHINKGAPSGFVISLLVHGAALLAAGLIVVLTVWPEPNFIFVSPSPFERPIMNPKKPRVRIRKSVSPEPAERIVANVELAMMPEILMPDLVGTGDGMGSVGCVGDVFGRIPPLGEPTGYGTPINTGKDLVGTFFDFKRSRSGATRPVDADPSTYPNGIDIIVHEFMESGWRASALSRFYRAPTKLFTPAVCIGTVQSTLAPEAFGETTTDGYAWAVLYEGRLVYYEDIKFRFRGVGDKFMAVRVDGEVVLLCAYNDQVRDYFTDIWESRDGESRVYPMGEGRQNVGDWIELKGGEPVDIQILLGDRQGGLVYHQLVVEVEGEEYPDNPYGGGPRLPVFKTDNLTRAQIDALYVDVYPGDVCLTNGPVFSDIRVPPVNYNPEPLPNTPEVMAVDASKETREWTSTLGQTMEGRLMSVMGDTVILEDTRRNQLKIEKNRLSEEDQRFIDLARPPTFRIEFSKRSDQVELTTLGPYDYNRPLSIFDFTFGARIKQYSAGTYNHELTVEYFAVGGEVNGDNYVLLDRGKGSFVPSKSNNNACEVYGTPVRLREYTNRAGSPMRGTKYDGYLILVTDEEGRVVQYETSNEFLFRNAGRLKQLPVRAHFDRDCNRTFPPRPIDADRGPGAYL